MRTIELLAPAKNAEIGIEAINHGADAVYIGAPKFGARAAAGNSIDEIALLVTHAHLYGAKVYVALNTIIYDQELPQAIEIANQLYTIGVDALIVQDMALVASPDMPPIALHASTQCDIRTPQKARFLENIGFSQLVLARELSLLQISEIKAQTTVPLEIFIHGALCVSYSGQCYLSQALASRSANRGACAQYCRLPYSLTDAHGNELVKDKHLLSLKDLNLTDKLEQLIEIGVSSFKIEGRLKDLSYVKNITAHYRHKIDEILKRHPQITRSSQGITTHSFTPQPQKSFSRPYTTYFITGRPKEIIASIDTPKSMGEPVGRVKEIQNNNFTIAGIVPINNGDGLCYLKADGEFTGFRVNRTESNRIFPLTMPHITPKTPLYRNYDHEFEKQLSKPSAQRKIAIKMLLTGNADTVTLQVEDHYGNKVKISEPHPSQLANSPQIEQIKKQLSKLGNTIFETTSIDIQLTESWFLPASLLAELRRKAIETLLELRQKTYKTPQPTPRVALSDTLYPHELDFTANIANKTAKTFYEHCGAIVKEMAYELQPVANAPLMQTKYCILHTLGRCPREHNTQPMPTMPLYLHYKERTLRVECDCKICEMKIYLQSTPQTTPNDSII